MSGQDDGQFSNRVNVYISDNELEVGGELTCTHNEDTWTLATTVDLCSVSESDIIEIALSDANTKAICLEFTGGVGSCIGTSGAWVPGLQEVYLAANECPLGVSATSSPSVSASPSGTPAVFVAPFCSQSTWRESRVEVSDGEGSKLNPIDSSGVPPNPPYDSNWNIGGGEVRGWYVLIT